MRATLRTRSMHGVWCYPKGIECFKLMLTIDEPKFPTCLWCAAAEYR